MSTPAMPVARQLLLYFCLGAVLFLADRASARWPPPWQAPERIEIAADEVQSLRNSWSQETGHLPTDAQLSASVQKRADDEVLLREALRQKLDVTDTVVRSRLIQNLRFASPHSRQSDDELLREALALGMARYDTVVRRRLVQALEQRIAASTRISERQLRAFVAAHPERYATPERIRFAAVFLDVDRHGSSLPAVATAMAQALAQLSPEAAERQHSGDRFLLGTRFGPSTRQELAQQFGAGFAAGAFAAPEGRWSAAIASAYGLHFVRVLAREPQRPADFTAVRRQAYYALLEEQEKRSIAEALAAMRERYVVFVDGVQLDRTAARASAP